MKTSLIFLFITAIFFFSGCETKRKYFEPSAVTGNVNFNKTLPSKINEVGLKGGTLENGQIITDDGLSSTQLPEGFKFLNKIKSNIIASNNCGQLNIINEEDGKIIFNRQFSHQIISASMDKNILALISSTNKIYLLDMDTNTILLEDQKDIIYAVDFRMAPPYFLGSIVLFPTLDGKIVLIDRKNGELIRNIVISGEYFFNNIIFLDVVDDKMIAATAKRVISVSSQSTAFYDDEIKNILPLNDQLLILTKDGKMVLASSDLQVLKEKKFDFAIFSALKFKNKAYVLEKNGFLFSIDEKLDDIKIYKISEKIDDMVFISKDEIFYKNKYLDLNQIIK